VSEAIHHPPTLIKSQAGFSLVYSQPRPRQKVIGHTGLPTYFGQGGAFPPDGIPLCQRRCLLPIRTEKFPADHTHRQNGVGVISGFNELPGLVAAGRRHSRQHEPADRSPHVDQVSEPLRRSRLCPPAHYRGRRRTTTGALSARGGRRVVRL